METDQIIPKGSTSPKTPKKMRTESHTRLSLVRVGSAGQPKQQVRMQSVDAIPLRAHRTRSPALPKNVTNNAGPSPKACLMARVDIIPAIIMSKEMTIHRVMLTFFVSVGRTPMSPKMKMKGNVIWYH